MSETMTGNKIKVNVIDRSEERSVEEALAYAIEAIDNGNIENGSAALEWVIQREPQNPIAWLWLACTVTDEHKKRDCYARIQV